MASLSKPTTLFPSAPDALKPLVQLIRIPWMDRRETFGFSRRVADVPVTTSYLVDVLVSHGEREGETQRKLLVLHVMVVQKVGHALCDVVEQLQRKQMRHDVKRPQNPKTVLF